MSTETWKSVARIVAALAFRPLTVGIIIFWFREHLTSLAKRANKVTVKAWGTELTLSAEETESVLGDLLKEVVETTSGLSARQKELFPRKSGQPMVERPLRRLSPVLHAIRPNSITYELSAIES